MTELFTGTGIAHTILLFAVVIASGLWLGRFKVKGISIGSTWILFLGILLSHFGFRADPTALAFMKDFGLILFVFSIGLQVGPGFFQSFRKGGVKLNLLATMLVLLAVLTTLVIHWISGEELTTMVGVMSGAVTNTPGLGAAQQTLSDAMVAVGSSREAAAQASGELASAYAVAYPIGVLGVIFLVILFKGIFKIDIKQEQAEMEAAEASSQESARRMHCEVQNPAVFGKRLAEIVGDRHEDFVVSRIMRDGVITIPDADTVLQQGDKVLIVTSQAHVDMIRIIFGEEVPMHLGDWQVKDEHLVSHRLVVSNPALTGKSVRSLHIRARYGVTVTRVMRAGLELVARPNLVLEMGDSLLVVGTEEGIHRVADLVGNKPGNLNHPNLIPIFFGIALGVIFGSIPISFPGIPQPVRLGLAGGPLIIAILLGHFGPRWRITTYTTQSANLMLREIGISFFLAAVGLGAGENFVSAVVNGGYWWILYGALITLVPVLLTGVVARLACKLNFYQICGLISGGTTDPAVLAFSQGAYGTDYTSINYATVYPLSMFLRVLVAQLMVLFAFSGCTPGREELRNGDLVFVGIPADYSLSPDSMGSAIADATGSDTGLNLIHTAILEIDAEGRPWIIDATIKRGVDRHPLDTFLVDFTLKDGSLPVFKVMRLKDDSAADDFVENAKRYLGRPYDTHFGTDDSALYCTELVYASYRDANGTPLFHSAPMNFKNSAGEFPLYWQQLFELLGEPIPQDQPGTNPQDMARESILRPVDASLVKE